MIGRSYKSFMSDEQVAIDVKILIETDKAGKDLFEMETTHIHKDGTLVYLILNGVFMRDEQGNITGASGTAKDISRRKENQEALREVEERFRKIYQSSPALVAISTVEEAIILDINNAWSETLGYTREEAINKTVYELGIFADPDSRRRAVRAGGQNRHFSNEAQYVTKTGEVRDFLVSAESIEFDGQNCYLFISQDITDLKLAEQEARVHRDQLAHVTRVSTMGEMATSLAHELNQPLAAMTAYVDGSLKRLRAGETPSEEILEALAKASGQAYRAGNIIRRLRDFIADTGSHIGSMYINDAVNAVIDLTTTEIRQEQIRLNLELGDSLPPVIGDEILLQQVIMNLARNSIEAMAANDHGTRKLTIRTEMEDPENVLLTVCDTGPGVIDGDTEHIFDPYFTTKESGLGLGLSICRSIIERHNGRIWAEPLDAGGIKFSIRLPSASA